MLYDTVTTISLAVSALSGALGAYWATVQRPNSKKALQIVEIAMGSILAMGVLDKYIGHSSIPYGAMVSLPVGVASGFVLDVLAELLPTAVRNIASIVLEFLPTVVREVIKATMNSRNKK